MKANLKTHSCNLSKILPFMAPGLRKWSKVNARWRHDNNCRLPALYVPNELFCVLVVEQSPASHQIKVPARGETPVCENLDGASLASQ